MTRQLNLGCGISKARRFTYEPGPPQSIRQRAPDEVEWDEVTHVDELAGVNPDVVMDVYDPDDMMATDWVGRFDEVHMYEIVEHLGRQGDYREWLAFWSCIYRVLRPGGRVFITAPLFPHRAAVEDPGHTRFIAEGSFWWLDPCILEENRKANSTMTQYPINFHLHNEYAVKLRTGDGAEPDHLYVVLRRWPL